MNPKCKRITLEYEDGLIIERWGTDAEATAQQHRFRYPKLEEASLSKPCYRFTGSDEPGSLVIKTETWIVKEPPRAT